MIATGIGIIGVAILIVFFLYAKTETLRREVLQIKRQLSASGDEINTLVESIEVLAFEQQIELRKQLTKMKSFGHPDVNYIKYTETLIDALISVVIETGRGEKNAVESFRKYLVKKSDISFADFTDFISKQDDKVKTEWHKKSVNGYLIICRHLIEGLSGETSEN